MQQACKSFNLQFIKLAAGKSNYKLATQRAGIASWAVGVFCSLPNKLLS